MKDLEKLEIRYIGYREPETDKEVELEILGLYTAIAAANQRIAVLQQSIKMRDLLTEITNEKNISASVVTKETKQTS